MINGLLLNLISPPPGSSPEIMIPCDRITAVRKSDFNNDLQKWGSAVHVIGGEVFKVTDDYDWIIGALS